MRTSARDTKNNSRISVIVGCIVIVVFVIIISLAIIHRVNSVENIESVAENFDNSITYDYKWTDDDLQGDSIDEVATAYILLKANGYDVNRTEFSSVSPTDKAYQLAETLNPVLNRVSQSSRIAVPITGQNLLYVPAPAIIWIEENEEVRPVVFLYADEATVTVADPSEGVKEYPFSVMHKMYDAAVRQCVYITDRGYLCQ